MATTPNVTVIVLSCGALLEKIRETRGKWQNEENENTTKNIIGGALTLGTYNANEEDELMLRERVKSL